MHISKVWFRYRRLLTVVLLLAVLFGLVHWTSLQEDFSLAFLRHELADNQWTGLAIFVLLFVIGNLVQIPGWLFLAASVLILGRLGGAVVTYVAAITSCAFTFLTVRWVGGDAVRQLKGKLATRLMTRLHARPIRTIVFLRTLLQTLPALNYALAMSGIPFRQYMVATLLGLPLPIAVYCIFFDSLRRLFNIG
nr:VTT domain-containing protein [Rhodoferax sp.]